MDIFPADASRIDRIGEIDRTELIEAKYRCRLSADGGGIVLRREELESPELFPDWDEAGVERRARWWKREIDEGGALFLAEEEGRVKGFAVLGPEKAGRCAEMVALFVDRAHRGTGLGRRLVESLEVEAARRGIEAIYVQSNETVASVGFYQRVGYTIACLMDPTTMWLPMLETSIVLAKRL